MGKLEKGALVIREHPDEVRERLEYLKDDFEKLKRFADDVYFTIHPEEEVVGVALPEKESFEGLSLGEIIDEDDKRQAA